MHIIEVDSDTMTAIEAVARRRQYLPLRTSLGAHQGDPVEVKCGEKVLHGAVVVKGVGLSLVRENGRWVRAVDPLRDLLFLEIPEPCNPEPLKWKKSRGGLAVTTDNRYRVEKLEGYFVPSVKDHEGEWIPVGVAADSLSDAKGACEVHSREA